MSSTPSVVGLSHLGFSVPDLDAAVAFWTGTMGFDQVVRADDHALLVHRDDLVVIGLRDHGGTVTGPFDERRTGLDHVSLAVADEAALHEWARYLADRGVENSGVVQTEAGWVLNLRGPDRFPVELFVLSPGGAAAFGLT